MPGDKVSKLEDLKRQRGNFKGRLTQFKKFIDTFTGAVLTQIQVAEIQLRIQAACDIYKRYNDVEMDIELLLTEADMSSNADYVESFETLYFTTMAVANCLVNSADNFNSSIMLNQENSCSQKPVSVKLPYIKLPSFDGSYDHWLEFKNSYITMIHKRTDLDEIQKFHYLRSALDGTALQVISALEFTPSNYLHAWELLENRFHNTRLLVNNHVKSLFNIPCLKQESSSLIRKLMDTVLRNLRALNTLEEPTDAWDTLIIYLMVSKLDSSTEREWENHKGTISLNNSNQKYTLDDLLSFLRNRADMLDMISANHSRPKDKPLIYGSKVNSEISKRSSSSNNFHSYVTSKNEKSFSNNKLYTSKGASYKKCVLCEQNHALYTCIAFLNMSVKDRLKYVDDKKLCRNCLRAGHMISECVFGPCKQCQRKHNSLLHIGSSSSQNELNVCVREDPGSVPNRVHASTSNALHCLPDNTSGSYECNNNSEFKVLQTVLLSTALVEVADNNNVFHTARALLDSGSQNCFITERMSNRLNVSNIQSTVRITGVGQTITQSSHSCDINIRSKLNDYHAKIRCIVLPSITSSLPTISIDSSFIRIPKNIKLADPNFDVPADIDLLIGADKFWDLLDADKIRLPSGPYLQNSKLGWLITGPVFNNTYSHTTNNVQCNFTQDIGRQLRLFWELEEVALSPRAMLSEDEQKCEKLFINTNKRDREGRFSVRIPLRESADVLGDSYTLAKKRFLSLERKLERLPEFKRMYTNFMREYHDLGHMSKVTTCSQPNYYLPHHGVIKESSSTTKLRVVFDASAVTSSNKSLNDIQFPGPALQNDIFSILLRFRQYKFVACADVEKMFRQVLIQSDQRSLQLILWRENPTDPLETYQLNTVTYGTASAPYLSMRCIRQLALECDDDVIARVITQDIFVDDLISGDDDYHNLLRICEKTSQILHSGCFPLRKWKFNLDISQNKSAEHFIGEHAQTKTLGLGWHNTSDELYFVTNINSDHCELNLTKRIMLSIISQIYDPLGLLSPAVIISKIFLQNLWLSRIDWDTPVSADITKAWKQFIYSLRFLKEIRIPRHVRSEHTQYTELHIFTDASQSAYGACAYIRTYSDDSEITVRLLCAKSKVAPLKSISIPRLELCGALVGAKLYKKVSESLRLKYNKVYFWTDSTIVMGWIKTSPHLLKTFIQNRVTEINELTGELVWSHVNGKDNPADLLSRGCSLDLLRDSDLWWYGPSFLRESYSINIKNSDIPNCQTLPELKSKQVSLISTEYDDLIDFKRFESFTKLKRIGAYVLRFINNTRAKDSRQTGSLTLSELNASQRMLIRLVQIRSFPDIYNNLINKIPIRTNCKQYNRISSLNVFLDDYEIIRVGGRLSNASCFNFDKKHPVLLCSRHPFTVSLFRYEHKRLLHGGPQLMLATMREYWWPLNAKNLAKRIIRECVMCTRIKGKTLTPIMGNLPSERLEPSFPFMKSGVDYAGPVFVLNRKGRGARLFKAYICLFICFTTRAIHLELVTSLSTNDYILALKRFISRRGKPNIIFSDNGKNFIGAEKEFPLFLENHSKVITDYAADNGIAFRFIPPYSPHFGGLWESGVRSCKYHLRRIVGNARLTYEEFTTVLTQIEAVLNSRPLSPLSTDPTDFTPLTPAHFLLGRPLTAPASEDLTDKSTFQLARYDRIEQLRQHFWRRWSTEYVSELQLRTKWKIRKDDIALDSLVLIKDDNLPPLNWRLGRIVRLYPGSDGVSRVADIRTGTGTIRRSFSKICPLPLQSAEENEDEA